MRLRGGINMEKKDPFGDVLNKKPQEEEGGAGQLSVVALYDYGEYIHLVVT